MFSRNLLVLDMKSGRWERRTPKGVGWSSHLYSFVDATGRRTDAFDKHVKRQIEDPAAPALKKLAVGGDLDGEERAAVAGFIALTAARNPQAIKDAMDG